MYGPPTRSRSSSGPPEGTSPLHICINAPSTASAANSRLHCRQHSVPAGRGRLRVRAHGVQQARGHRQGHSGHFAARILAAWRLLRRPHAARHDPQAFGRHRRAPARLVPRLQGRRVRVHGHLLGRQQVRRARGAHLLVPGQVHGQGRVRGGQRAAHLVPHRRHDEGHGHGAHGGEGRRRRDPRAPMRRGGQQPLTPSDAVSGGRAVLCRAVLLGSPVDCLKSINYLVLRKLDRLCRWCSPDLQLLGVVKILGDRGGGAILVLAEPLANRLLAVEVLCGLVCAGALRNSHTDGDGAAADQGQAADARTRVREPRAQEVSASPGLQRREGRSASARVRVRLHGYEHHRPRRLPEDLPVQGGWSPFASRLRCVIGNFLSSMTHAAGAGAGEQRAGAVRSGLPVSTRELSSALHATKSLGHHPTGDPPGGRAIDGAALRNQMDLQHYDEADAEAMQEFLDDTAELRVPKAALAAFLRVHA
ncbi:hypothetical protein ON010_g3712 [Phytophthora cinnamomi]|nr:hypothetical protein ON010_g3712 [Phytophthora cinnamomi]